jgi:hypothetical protein
MSVAVVGRRPHSEAAAWEMTFTRLSSTRDDILASHSRHFIAVAPQLSRIVAEIWHCAPGASALDLRVLQKMARR